MSTRISDERWAEVDELLDKDVPVREINRRTGITRPAIAKRREARQDPPQRASSPPPPRKPRTDPPPKPPRRPASSPRRAGPTDEQLESMCRKIAKAPAIPAKLVLRCDYCAHHFQATAPALAAELVEMSHEDQDLRGMLDALYTGWRRYAWAGLLASWAGVPLLHHAAPGFLYGAVAPIVGMPARGQPQPHDHPHPGTAGAGVPPPAPAPPFTMPPSNGAGAEPMPMVTPFDALDLDQLLSMAAQFGIQLPDGVTREMLESVLAGDELPIIDVEPTMNGDHATVPEADLPPLSDPAATDDAPAPAAEPDPPTVK